MYIHKEFSRVVFMYWEESPVNEFLVETKLAFYKSILAFYSFIFLIHKFV
jgi:hypothetical protein